MSETLSQDGRAYLRAFEQDRTPLGVSEEIARLKQQLHDTRDELRVYRLASEQAIYDAQQYDPTLYLNTDRGVEDVMRRVLARLGEYEGADKRWHSFETAQAIAEERDATVADARVLLELLRQASNVLERYGEVSHSVRINLCNVIAMALIIHGARYLEAQP